MIREVAAAARAEEEKEAEGLDEETSREGEASEVREPAETKDEVDED